jgi:hypothetical protein
VRWNWAVGAALAILFFAIGRLWFPRPVFAMRDLTHFAPALYAVGLFAAYAMLQAWMARRVSGPSLERWLRRDALALAFWLAWPLVWIVPRFLNVESLLSPEMTEKMLGKGFELPNRVMVYSMGFFYLGLICWKGLACFAFLHEIIATHRRTAHIGLLAMACLTFGFTAFWTCADYVATGDEPHYLLMAHSLAYDLDADLTNNVANEDYRAFRETLEMQAGRLFNHEIGFSLAIAPAYRLGGRTGAALFLALVAAATLLLTQIAVERLTGDARLALLATGAIGFLTPFHFYSSQIFPEMLAALLVAGGMALIVSPRFESPSRLVGLGGILFALPLVKARFALLSMSLVVCGIGMLRKYRKRALTTSFALGAAGLGLLFLVDLFVLDHPTYLPKARMAFHPLMGIYSMGDYWNFLLAGVLDRSSGFFIYGPVALLSLSGVALALRRNWVTALLVGQIALLYYFIKSPYWRAGWCPPGRYIVCIAPAATLFLAYGLDLTRGRWGRVLAWTLAILSAAIVFTLNLVLPLRYASPVGGGSPLLDILGKVTGLPLKSWTPTFQENSVSGYESWHDITVSPYNTWIASAVVAGFLALGWVRALRRSREQDAGVDA